MTRAAVRKAALDRVLKEIMGAEDDDPLILAVEQSGIKSVSDLLSLSEEDIGDLKFINKDEDDKGLPIYAKNEIKILKAWNIHLAATLNIRAVDWMDEDNVTADEYDDFCVSAYDPDAF